MPPLSLDSLDSAPETVTCPPVVFARAIDAVAAMPWDQSRAARLDAILNAPIPTSDVALVLRRIGRWAYRSPARFAAIYARQSDVGDGLSTTIELDGRPMAVSFPSARRRMARARLLLVVTTVVTTATFLFVATAATIWSARSQAEQRLAALEQQAARNLLQAQAAERISAQSRALDAQGVRGTRAADVLGDLAWASMARKPDARVAAFHWEAGVVAVEARGEDSPLAPSDRLVERSSSPVRPGTWLWGVRSGQVAAPTP